MLRTRSTPPPALKHTEDSTVWRCTAPAAPDYPRLDRTARADVTVVGGGFCGLSACLHLAQAGFSVTLLEARHPAWGASGRNGGQVIPGLKRDPEALIKAYGRDRGERLAALAGGAPDLVFDLIKRYDIRCDARRTGWIQLAPGPRALREIEGRVQQWRQRGVDIEILDGREAARLTGARGYIGGLLDRRGGNLNPLAFGLGLANAAHTLGVKIYAESPVASIQQIKGRWVVETPSAQATSKRLLLCTNAYTDALWPGLEKTVIPFVSGVVATAPLPEEVRRTILPQGQAAADNRRLLCWFGLDRDGRLLFGGRSGSASRDQRPQDCERRVQHMHALFPQVRGVPVEHCWSGRIALTPDFLPHIYKLANNLYAGLGFNGRGVAMATLMGKLLAGRLVEADADDFPETRLRPIPFHGARSQVVHVAVLWKRLMDRLNP